MSPGARGTTAQGQGGSGKAPGALGGMVEEARKGSSACGNSTDTLPPPQRKREEA